MTKFKKYQVLILIVCFILTQGCMKAKQNVIEEIAPAIMMYITKDEQENITVTTIVPPVKKRKKELY